ncbi:MAG: ERCC4 domain-containing protein [Clostridia bacterium]|nr:ERCC4 domain-containing protein [Clostridia bacterium]
MMKYNHFEIDEMLDSMVITYDTREQQTAKLKRRLKGFGCPVERKKLNFGDYSCCYTDTDGNKVYCDDLVAIERKMSLDELCACFCKGRQRFEREFLRAKQSGAKIHLLVEDGDYEKLFGGEYRSQLNPNSLIASYLAWAERYEIQLHFCREETTKLLIPKILKYWLKNHLEQMEE